MLIFKYNGIQNNTKTYRELAIQDNYKSFYDWLLSACQEWNLSPDLTNKLDMCGEEIFANVSFYAYPPDTGMIDVELQKTENNIVFEIKDSGIEYNPLEKPDPNINLPPEERPIGGLGIYMMKQMADKISYRRENDKNILTLEFNI